MKNLNLCLVFALQVGGMISPAFSETAVVDGITWLYTIKDGEASVGGGSWDLPAVPRTAEGCIKVPSAFGSFPVTRIDSYAFYMCEKLECVEIQEGVVSIGEDAFGSCRKLVSVEIPASVKDFGRYAFSYCPALMNITLPEGLLNISAYAFIGCSKLDRIAIPASTTNIHSRAFRDAKMLELNVADGNLYYKSENGLLLTKDSQSVVRCWGGAENVKIPEGVVEIADYAFYSCDWVMKLEIPASVIGIGYGAFWGCKGLERIELPKSVLRIGERAFCNCLSLQCIAVDSQNPVFSSCDGALYCRDAASLVSCPAGKSSIVLDGGVRRICAEAFVNCDKISSVSLPFGLTNIENNAFSDCRGIVKIEIPESVIGLEAGSFSGCVKLQEISVDAHNPVFTSVDGVVYDKDVKRLICCPYGRSYLTVPDTVDEVGWEFTLANLRSITVDYDTKLSYLPYGLQELYVKNSEWGMPNADEWVFGSVGDGFQIYVDSESRADRTWYGFMVKMAPTWWMGGVCYSLFGGVLTARAESPACTANACQAIIEDPAAIHRVYEVAMEGDFDEIAAGAFQYFEYLSKVKIPDGVKCIGESAFYGCSRLTAVTIPDSVVRIGESAFCGCEFLGEGFACVDNCLVKVGYSYSEIAFTSVSDGTRLIADGTFKNCKIPSVVQIPDSVEHMGKGAFPGYVKLVFNESLDRFKWIDGAIYSAMGDCVWEPSVDVKVISTEVRKTDPTILDVRYVIRGVYDAVNVKTLAFENGTRSWANVVRPETFIANVDGSASQVGDGMPCNVTNSFAWRVSADYKNNLAKLRVEVFVEPEDLLPLEFMQIPDYDGHPALEFSYNTLTDVNVMNALYWLYADKDVRLTLVSGQLKSGSTRLANGTSLDRENAVGYVFQKLGYERLTNSNYLPYVNAETRLGLSPSGVRQYAVKEVSK